MPLLLNNHDEQCSMNNNVTTVNESTDSELQFLFRSTAKELPLPNCKKISNRPAKDQ